MAVLPSQPILGALLVLSASCTLRPVFKCTGAEECPEGRCEANQLCSETVSEQICTSGRQYSEYAGELSGQCVDDSDRTHVVIDFEDLDLESYLPIGEYQGIDFDEKWDFLAAGAAPSASCAFSSQTSRAALLFAQPSYLEGVTLWGANNAPTASITVTFLDSSGANAPAEMTIDRGVIDAFDIPWTEPVTIVVVESSDTWNFSLDNIRLSMASSF